MRVIFFTTTLFFVHVTQWWAWAIEIIPERPVVEYYNTSYISHIKIDIRKLSRQSPYTIHFDINIVSAVGNNVTVDFMLLEHLSSGYQPTPIALSIKLCDLFYNEIYVGQMLAKQFPPGWSCPFQRGRYDYQNLTVHLENFPYKLPFTWTSVNMKTRADINVFKTGTKVRLLTFKLDVTIRVKPTKKS